MNELPLISVIIPVYRVEKYLEKCIRSIVEQTYSNLDIILVDDGSPDNCGAICDAWAEKDSRIRVIHKENGGAGLARNVGLDAAAGSLIAFVDSDDYIAPNMYAQLYEQIEAGADVAECDFASAAGDDMVFQPWNGTAQMFSMEEAMRFHIYDIKFRQLIWNKLYRKEVIADIRFPEGTMIDDEFFTYRVLGNANRLTHCDGVGYAYRQQENSIMHRKFSVRRLDAIYAKKQRLEYLKTAVPELVYDARADLFLYGIHAYQMCELNLNGDDMVAASGIIKDALSEILPIKPSRRLSFKNNIWLILGQISFEGTCRLRNFLYER